VDDMQFALPASSRKPEFCRRNVYGFLENKAAKFAHQTGGLA
jgi:hypothetical protein